MAHVANYEGVNHGQYAVQVSTGIALPGGAYFDAPAAAVQGMAIVRSEDEKSWILIPDHRGEKIYYTGERYSTTLQTVGEVPAGYTLIAPETDFDTWNGTEWVTDSAAEKKHIILWLMKKRRACCDWLTSATHHYKTWSIWKWRLILKEPAC